MTKRYDEPIEVMLDRADDAPTAFIWRGRHYEIVFRIATWREAGEWHDGTGRYDREYFRVLARRTGGPTAGGPTTGGPMGGEAAGDDPDADRFPIMPSAVFDLYLDLIGGGWKLSRVWD